MKSAINTDCYVTRCMNLVISHCQVVCFTPLSPPRPAPPQGNPLLARICCPHATGEVTICTQNFAKMSGSHVNARFDTHFQNLET
jgi:hypothetical protein